MIYLGQPYSHPDKSVRYTRYMQGMIAAVELTRQGEHVYSPIVSWHEAASQHRLPHDFQFWRRFNLDMIERSDRFAILQIEGWEESEGLQSEAAFAFTTLLPGSVELIQLTPSATILRQLADLSILGEFTSGPHNPK